MLTLNHVEVRHQTKTLLSIPDLTIHNHQFTVVLGHNGSGKSTLMNVLARQLRVTEGRVSLHGKSIERFSQKQLAQQVAYLPQRLPEASGLTVLELVKLGRFPWRGSFMRWKKEDFRCVEDALTQTNMKPLQHQLLQELSGGERQRAFIAMLVAQQSPILLLDEPTSALDPAHQYELMNLLQRLNRQSQKGMVLVLHDINMALRYAQRIIALKQGTVFFDGTPEALVESGQLTALYGIDIHILDHPTLSSPCVAMS